jgi:hypothetical protein
MLYGLHEAVGFKQFVEDVLKDVLGFAGVSDMLANKTAKSGPVSLQCLSDELILLDNRPGTRDLVHLLV